MCDDISCKDCFWEYHGNCNYPWDCSETDTPNVPPLCIECMELEFKMFGDDSDEK